MALTGSRRSPALDRRRGSSPLADVHLVEGPRLHPRPDGRTTASRVLIDYKLVDVPEPILLRLSVSNPTPTPGRLVRTQTMFPATTGARMPPGVHDPDGFWTGVSWPKVGPDQFVY